MAGNTILRSACAAAAPLFTHYMFDTLGVGGGASLIGGMAVLLAPIPFVFYKYGEPIRKRSKFAPTPAVDDTVTDEEEGSQERDLGGEKHVEGEKDEEHGLGVRD